MVAVETELLHMTGEAEGLHAEEKQISFFKKLKCYYHFWGVFMCLCIADAKLKIVQMISI